MASLTSSILVAVLAFLALLAFATAVPVERASSMEIMEDPRDFIQHYFEDRGAMVAKSRRSPMADFDFTSALRSIDNIQKPRFGRRR